MLNDSNNTDNGIIFLTGFPHSVLSIQQQQKPFCLENIKSSSINIIVCLMILYDYIIFGWYIES